MQCCQIECEEAGLGCGASALMLQVEHGVADYPVHAGGGDVLFPSFSTLLAALCRVHRCGAADAQMLAVLDVFLRGSDATILTPMLLHQIPWRPADDCKWVACASKGSV